MARAGEARMNDKPSGMDLYRKECAQLERERVLAVVRDYLDDCKGVEGDMAETIMKGIRAKLGRG
jgi:hypothetical protein